MKSIFILIPLLAFSLSSCDKFSGKNEDPGITNVTIIPSNYYQYLVFNESGKFHKNFFGEKPIYSGPTKEYLCQQVAASDAISELNSIPDEGLIAASSAFEITIKISPIKNNKSHFKVYVSSQSECEKGLTEIKKTNGIVLSKIVRSKESEQTKQETPVPRPTESNEPWYNVSTDGRRCVPADMSPAQRIEWLRDQGVKYDAIDHAGLKVNGRVRSVTILPKTGNYPNWVYYGSRAVCEETEVNIEKYR